MQMRLSLSPASRGSIRGHCVLFLFVDRFAVRGRFTALRFVVMSLHSRAIDSIDAERSRSSVAGRRQSQT